MAELSSPAPVIKAFRILGLHGYKDIELTFAGPVSIAIAENGTGKTTILTALYTFLTGDYDRLRKLSFESIECDLISTPKPLTLRRDQLGEVGESSSVNHLAGFSSLDPTDVRRAILSMERVDITGIVQNPVLNEIYHASPLDAEEMSELCTAIRDEWNSSSTAELRQLAGEVQSAVSPCEILYLPTYRRVELARARPPEKPQRRVPSAVTRENNRAMRARLEDIRFGLADVEDRLRELVSEIQRQSNLGYRQISANIIDELITTGLPYDEMNSTALPDIDALALFLSRIDSRTGPNEMRVAPDARLAAIRDLYGTGKHKDSDKMLRYFLSKLSKVVDQTKVLEANIERFVEKANVYLQQSSDEKKLQYDSRRMRVVVLDRYTNNEVPLDDLSSGEKQVVSLFAHMYLYPAKKIVLIDEPELSLSIEWQKRLLPDVLDAPSCVQLFAITHSPFIFDNALDRYAGPIHVRRRAIEQ